MKMFFDFQIELLFMLTSGQRHCYNCERYGDLVIIEFIQ